ncbi:MAG: GNAT family N-acetyltransferase [Clostridiaceae bacterium]|jgi:carbonic anhydrase|nr:GNAT family N-acetyltransferase [Clostridiaceae bacterium]
MNPNENDSHIIIRQVFSGADIAEVRRLLADYNAELGCDLSFQSFQSETENLSAAYAPPAGRLFVAEYGDEIAGCAALRPFGNGKCEMKRMYIAPHLRGKGIGKLLAQEIISAAKEIGYKAILLDTIPQLKAAVSMYKSMGFQEISPYRENPLTGARFFRLDLR